MRIVTVGDGRSGGPSLPQTEASTAPWRGSGRKLYHGGREGRDDSLLRPVVPCRSRSVDSAITSDGGSMEAVAKRPVEIVGQSN